MQSSDYKTDGAIDGFIDARRDIFANKRFTRMTNRLKQFFDQGPTPPKYCSHCKRDGRDLEKIVTILNKAFSPNLKAKMVDGEAVITCKSKTVWIDGRFLVTGESSTES
jgi:hypothetical protein